MTDESIMSPDNRLFGKRKPKKQRPKTQKTKTQKTKTQKTKTQKTKTQKTKTLKKRKHAVCELLAADCRSHRELRVDMRVANNFAFCSILKSDEVHIWYICSLGQQKSDIRKFPLGAGYVIDNLSLSIVVQINLSRILKFSTRYCFTCTAL